MLDSLSFDEMEQELLELLERLDPAGKTLEAEGWESHNEQRILLESVAPAL